MRLFSTAFKRVLPLGFLAAAACADELAGPDVRDCDQILEVTIEDPATLTYLVAVVGDAVVESVTFTTPVGDSTVVSPPDQRSDEIQFVRSFDFDTPTDASLRVQGEVTVGGEISFSYIVDPFVGSNVDGPVSTCALL